MAQYQRRTSPLPNPGPWLGVITNHLDPTYMGAVEVALVKSTTNNPNLDAETVVVNYLSPFYGVTSLAFEGSNSARFGDAQKSYGFWAVPPDVGTTVLCIFIEGNINAGYWIGCVPDKYQNHMIPGIAASQNVEMTPEQEMKYGTRLVPVGEFTKKNRDLGEGKSVSQFNKPIHPFADRLLAQGLLLDQIRGVTSSSARREVPSMVFGMSTPGPIIKDSSDSTNYQSGQIGYKDKATVPVSRWGGTTFVMDDGDADGQNELMRIRTRTGHQILMHNTHDLIYIANSKGTAWIELTSNGKIDVYAKDSISLHTENDLNIRADRDINFEAGRNINIKANKAMDINVFDHFYMLVYDNAKISLSKNLDFSVADDTRLTVGGDLHISVDQSIYETAGSNVHVNAGSDYYATASASMNLKAGGEMKQASGAAFGIGAGATLTAKGSMIDLNNADPAAPTAATSADTADQPSPIPTFTVPTRSVESGWSNGVFYKGPDLTTIMQRVPMHEPWEQHENINPSAFNPENTDAGAAERPDVEATGNSAPPANTLSSVPGTCSAAASKAIGAAGAQKGIAALKAACAKAGYTSPYAVAAILGIAGGESAWVPQIEKYSYSPERLKQIFRSASPDVISKYSRWQGSREEFFSFFYGPTFRGKNFLGNLTDADGGKFYGRGYIQLTGRANYAAYSTPDRDLVNNPDLVNDYSVGADVAVAYFKKRCKAKQDDPSFINAALASVGVNAPDIHAKKMDYYQCFLSQLQGG